MDPQVYALNIMLQLEAEAAYESLNQFEEKLLQIEQSVSDTAVAAMNTITTNVQNTNAVLELTNRAFVDIRDRNTEISASIQDYTNYLENVSGFLADMQISSMGIAESMGVYNEFLKQIRKKSEDDLDKLTKTTDLWKDLKEHHEEISKSLKDERDNFEHIYKLAESYQKEIKSKNKLHDDENKLVAKEDGLWIGLLKKSGLYSENIERIAGNWDRVYGRLQRIVAALRALDSEVEQFIEINYRAYGSQQLLAQSSINLAMEVGLLRGRAVEAYKALADTKIPRNELDKLAKTVVLVNKYTGMAIPTLANFARSQRQIGLDSVSVMRQLNYAGEAMRKYGLTSEDTSKLLGVASDGARTMKMLFAGAVDPAAEVEKFNKIQLGLGGLAKTLGFTSDQVAQFQQQLADPVFMAKFQMVTGTQIKSAEDVTKAYLEGGRMMAEEYKRVEEASKQGVAAAAIATAKYQKMGEKMFGSAAAADMMRMTFEKAAAETKALGKDLDEATLEAGLMAAMEKDAAEASNTLEAQLVRLNELLSGPIGTVLSFFRDGLRDIVFVINELLEVISPFIGWLGTLSETLKETSPLLYRVYSVFRALITAVGIFIVVASGLAGVRALIRAVGQAAAEAAAQVGSGLGRGLAALGEAVRRHVVVLIGLAFAFTLVGAGIYLMASGLAQLKDAGMQAIGMLAGLLFVTGLFMVFLVGLGTAANLAVPGLLAIAAVLASIGLMIYLVGAGIQLAGQGFEMMSKSVTMELAGSLLAVNAALATFVVSAFATVPAVWALAGSFKKLATSASTISESMTLINDFVQALKGLDLGSSIDKFVNSLKQLSEGGVITEEGMEALRRVSGKIAEVARVLLPATLMLGVVSAVMGFSGLAFKTGAVALNEGAKLLGSTADMMIAAAPKLGEAVKILSPLMPDLVDIAMRIGGIGVILIVASGFFLAGSAILLAGSTVFALAASAIRLGSGLLLTSSEFVLESSKNLQTAGTLLLQGVTQLLPALVMLIPISGLMIVAGASMVAGGVLMLSGSTMIMVSSLALFGALMMLQGITGIFDTTIEKVSKLGRGIEGISFGFANLARSVLIGTALLSGISSTLGSELEKSTRILDQYASVFESTADRIQSAISDKIIPSMRAAQEAGIIETLRTETIITSPPMREVGEKESVATEDQSANAADVLSAISEKLSTIISSSNAKDILDLLRDHLPNVSGERGDTGLSSHMNGW
jgi:hypothetical protein